MIWGELTLNAALNSGIVAIDSLSFNFVVPFAVVFLTPFQGVAAITKNNWVLRYSIIALFGLLWMVTNFNKRRLIKVVNEPFK